MTKNEGTAWGTEYVEATTELRRTLAERLQGRPLPPDLVITTRGEIEKREFRAYGQGWRDRGEHDERRRAEREPERRAADGAKVLPFRPQSPADQQQPPSTPAAEPPAPQRGPSGPHKDPSGPHPHPSGPPSARPHPEGERW